MEGRVQDKIAEQKRRIANMENPNFSAVRPAGAFPAQDETQLAPGVTAPAAAAQQQKDIEAAKEAERKGIAQQKQEQEANLQARKNRKAQRRQGGAGGGEVAGGNVNEIVTALTGEQFAATVQNAFTAGGNYVGEQITQALKAIPSAIDLKAQLGPVTVNLTGGKILQELKNGILKEMHGAIKTAIDARFNADGSVKDTSTQSVVPRDPGGRPLGHHRGEVAL